MRKFISRMRKLISSLFTKKARSTAIEGAITAMGTAKAAGDAFPPLKAVLGGILDVIAVCKRANDNLAKARILESYIHDIERILEAYPNTLTGVEELARSLDERKKAAEDIQQRGQASKMANSAKDADDLDSVFSALSDKIGLFLVENVLSMQPKSEKTLTFAELGFLRDQLKPIGNATYNDGKILRGPCIANTRVKILADILHWAKDPNARTIYCLNGMAGTGKTTIAYSLCQILRTTDHLAASFFCSRSEKDCGGAQHIAPTIAYQIAFRIPEFREKLLPHLSSPDFERTLQSLVAEPFEVLDPNLRIPSIVVIDAFDECEWDGHTRKVLDALSDIGSQSSSRIKFFITFRPGRRLPTFINKFHAVYETYNLQSVDGSIVEGDIRLFLEKKLRHIGPKHRFSDWPSHKDITALAKLSGGLFIFASTAQDFICDAPDPRKRLHSVLNQETSSIQNEKIDQLYGQILHGAFHGLLPSELEKLSNILLVIITAHSQLRCSDISSLLGIENDYTIQLLAGVRSLIHLPPSIDGYISTLHASFPDFLSSQERSSNQGVSLQKSHLSIALKSLDLLSSSLRENMCSVEGRPENRSIPSDIIEKNISGPLSYACQHWGMHSYHSGKYSENPDLQRMIQAFFSKSVLRWIEYLSFDCHLYDAIRVLGILEGWVSQSYRDVIKDARRFISFNITLLPHHALETYYSALVWLPTSSPIRQTFATPLKLPQITKGLPEHWEASEEMTFESHSVAYPQSVAFSQNSKYIAAASDEHIMIWDAGTGEEVQTFAWDHDDLDVFQPYYPIEVAFLSDGSKIVVASGSGVVQVWDLETGEEETQTSTGYFKWIDIDVVALAFSQKGDKIAVGSNHGYIGIWDVGTRKEVATLDGPATVAVVSIAFSSKGDKLVLGYMDGSIRVWKVGRREEVQIFHHPNKERVSSVAFSPDEEKIVSGSWDSTVQVWDANTGKEMLIFHHPFWVSSVSFSPDGSKIVSGCEDGTVRVWDIETQNTLATSTGHQENLRTALAPDRDNLKIVSGGSNNGEDTMLVRLWKVGKVGVEEEVSTFAGHSGLITALCFSPKGDKLVSSSESDDDATMRMWEVQTGKEVQTFTGDFGDSISSIAFSVSGNTIMSASENGIFQVWDVETGELVKAVGGDSQQIIESVVFSPDRHRIACAVYSHPTIQVWDMEIGKKVQTFTQHSGRIKCLAFSPNGDKIVSSSFDNTIRVWEVGTGKEVQKLTGTSVDSNHSVAFSPGGDEILGGSRFQWDIATGKEVRYVPGDTDPFNRPISANGHWISGVGPHDHNDPSSRLWIPPAYRDYYNCKGFHDNYVAVGYETGNIVIIVL